MVEDSPIPGASRFQRVIDWFRVGYPAGMPAHGYSPTAALLTRRMTDEECAAAAIELTTGNPTTVTETDIRVFITKFTQELPLAQDVKRVTSILERGGHRVLGCGSAE